MSGQWSMLHHASKKRSFGAPYPSLLSYRIASWMCIAVLCSNLGLQALAISAARTMYVCCIDHSAGAG